MYSLIKKNKGHYQIFLEQLEINMELNGKDKQLFFSQFFEKLTNIIEEYGIIIVKLIVHILNNKGELLFKFKLTHDTSNIKFYTLVPYIYKEGKNWHCEIDNIRITVNSYSYTIITAHIIK